MKILLTGSSGLVGSAIKEKIKSKDLLAPSSNQVNLNNKNQIFNYLQKNKPDLIIHCAGKVGGILKNINNQDNFLIENTEINLNLISVALKCKIKKFLNISSSCIYPKNIQKKIKENQLLQSYPEPTNEGYALAKISALKLCEFISKKYNLSYKSLIPCNIYGPNDNFDLNSGHLIPSVINKIYLAKKKGSRCIEIWGTGNVKREFMHVDDLADAVIFFSKKIKVLPNFMNVGFRKDYTVKQYYKVISDIIGYEGKFRFDRSKPEGMKRKFLDHSQQDKFGWFPKISLENGIKNTYKYFLSKYE